jgi:hypothetical protein
MVTVVVLQIRRRLAATADLKNLWRRRASGQVACTIMIVLGETWPPDDAARSMTGPLR